MADITKNKKTKNINELTKSIAWLIEATARAFVGWALITHSKNYIALAVAVYFLATSGLIVISHFYKAHK